MPYKDIQKDKEWRKEWKQLPKQKKYTRITKWKSKGLICDDYDAIYERWLKSEKCEKKGCEYTPKNKKCMDHDHETGLFRNILCNRCNTQLPKQGLKRNNIYYRPNKNLKYEYKKKINYKSYSKSFNTYEEALAYKEEFEKNLL